MNTKVANKRKNNSFKSIVIMAGGTGGHIYPALAVAKALIEKGHKVTWLGTPHGMESHIVPDNNIDIDFIPIKGLRGNGLLGWLLLPWRLFKATWLARKAIKKRKADLVLGFGGFVSGPGGLASKLLGVPLVIHEQNAIFGMTNRYLSKLAQKTYCAFENSKPLSIAVTVIGNPLRQNILQLSKEKRTYCNTKSLKVLVVGGSQGALSLNQIIPKVLSQLPEDAICVKHQAGKRTLDTAQQAYKNCACPHEVTPYIEDMAAAYQWADLVICRAGALTVSEIAAAGVAAIFIPHPHVVDDHQTANAHWLSDQGAALCIQQSELSEEYLKQLLESFIDNRAALKNMSFKAHSLAKTQATDILVNEVDALLA